MKNRLIFIIIVCLCSSLYAQNAVDLYNTGEEHFQRSNWDDALYYYKQALEKNPYYSKALIRIITINYKINNYEETEKYVNKLLKTAPNNTDGLVYKGKLKLIEQKDDEALKIFTQVKKIEPMNYDALLGIAKVYIKRRYYDEAKKYLDKVLRIDEKRVDGYVVYAEFYIARKKLKEAKAKLKKGEYFNPADPGIYFYYGLIYDKENDFRQARVYYEKSYYSDPEDHNTVLNLSDVYFKLGEWTKAIEFIENSISAFPNMSPLYNKLALSYQFNNDIDNAVKNFIKAYELKSTDDIIKFQLEDVLILKRSFYNKDRKRFAGMHFKNADNYNKNFNRYDALYEYKRGLQLHSENWKERYNLANLYKRTGFLEKYLKELQVALMLDPNNKYINDKLEVARTFKKDRLSYELGIDQYKVNKDRIKIYVPAFNKNDNNYINNQSGKVVAESIKNHLNLYSKFEVIFDTKDTADHYFNVNRNEVRKTARSLGADYYLFGSLKENEDYLSINFKIYPVRNDEPVNTFSGVARGKDKLYYLSKDMASQINGFFRISGTVIRIEGNDIVVNVGQDEEIKKGDILEIYDQGGLSKDFHLHKFYKRPGKVRGTAKVTRIDEQIALAALEDLDFVNKVSVNDKIVLIKKEKEKKKIK
ncbi:MAG: tetratricopeptide repeat protein [Spirochaetes bacterium]|nr:tetratricopeptide repeat protein [Spirochaetota bacterium]